MRALCAKMVQFAYPPPAFLLEREAEAMREVEALEAARLRCSDKVAEWVARLPEAD